MNYLQKRVTLFTLISFFSMTIYAQYGNEWINYNQQYLRVKISEEGVYRIDQRTFTNLGAKLISLNPKNIKVFRHGVEQSIYVRGEADNSFDASDYIEFYAKGNDGKLDTKLYGSLETQGHDRLSLYEEEAVYFITWGNVASTNHLSDFYDSNYAGRTADDYYMHTSWLTPKDDVYDGIPFSSPGHFSTYTKGEGFYSSYFSGTRETILRVPSDNYVTFGPAPIYEIYAGGKSNPDNSVGGINQEMQVRAIRNGQVLANKQFFGYDHFKLTGTLSTNEMESSSTQFGFSSVFGDKARQAVSYVKITYPRSFSMNNENDYLIKYTSSNTYLKMQDYPVGKSAPYVIDFINGERIKADINTGSIEFNRSGNSEGHLFIYDSSDVRKLTISEVSNAYISGMSISQNPDYIIITHLDLANSANEYKTYRESTAGGSHKVLVAYTSNIYDQFFYGQHHPLALKNFAQYLANEQSTAPENLLLLGKGYTYDMLKGTSAISMDEDLVPTYGMPPSDILLTSQPELDDLSPRIAIGRVPAKTNEDVQAYLDKVKEHELGLNTSRKYLMMTGGYGLSEQNALQADQNRIFQNATVKPFEAKSVVFTKTQVGSVDPNQQMAIQDSINAGVAMVAFFGHSAAQVLELDMGPVASLNNKGKYPLFIFNGASVGDVFSSLSLTEELLLTPEVGAVSVVAHTTFQFVDPATNWSSTFTKNLFEDNYGEGIGEVVKQTISDYQNPMGNFNAAQCNQRNYFGDPALTIYSPQTSLSVAKQRAFESSIRLYPNPTNGVMNIVAPRGTVTSLLSPYGQLIIETKDTVLDLSTQPAGIYLVKCTLDGNQTTQKIMVTD